MEIAATPITNGRRSGSRIRENESERSTALVRKRSQLVSEVPAVESSTT